jgi:hypothetical protein
MVSFKLHLVGAVWPYGGFLCSAPATIIVQDTRGRSSTEYYLFTSYVLIKSCTYCLLNSTVRQIIVCIGARSSNKQRFACVVPSFLCLSTGYRETCTCTCLELACATGCPLTLITAGLLHSSPITSHHPPSSPPPTSSTTNIILYWFDIVFSFNNFVYDICI